MTTRSKAFSKFVGDAPARRYADPRVAMTRLLELANAAEADKGRLLLGPLNRVLLEEGASVAEYGEGLKLALAEGLLELHASGAYVIFTQKGAERFA